MAEEQTTEETYTDYQEAEEELEDENLRKLFLGGLKRSTTKEDLEEHFGKLGTVVHAAVAMDQQQNSKGFAFVTMKTIDETDSVLLAQEESPMDLQGKKIEVRRAIPKNSNVSSDVVKKVFVAGLNKGVITEDDLKEYFSKIGTVKSVSIVMDQVTSKSKGFGFVEFEHFYMVDKAALMTDHYINDIKVDVNKAHADKNQGQRGGRGGGYGRGGRGGGRGFGRGGYGGGGGNGGYGGGYGGGGSWGNGYQNDGGYGGGYGGSGYYEGGGSNFGPSRGGGFGSRGRGRGGYRPY
ncbi:glycine-rich RNA-binding protein GRP1A-like [Asterias rubens]|uniref:glycine-rich RNA-binding protein GRP1A-like n=1 Tax=Asterias rubens TaxID=7604 RepID=UPI0014557450|nr:glycine-rich RNA-binding protein GRP1A-like [Asterias rubens]